MKCGVMLAIKDHPRWLWHAIDHTRGEILAYVFGDRKDAVFLELKVLLEPFGITRFYTDGWGAYERHLPPQQQYAILPLIPAHCRHSGWDAGIQQPRMASAWIPAYAGMTIA